MNIKNIINLVGSIACFSINLTTVADEVITLFLKKYPTITTTEQSTQKIKNLKYPGLPSSNSIQGRMHKEVSTGVIATYGGYLNASDYSGELEFPRSHTEPTVYILITPKISPVVMIENTLHHWNLEADVPAQLYKMERKKDPDAELYYWDVQEVPLPENKMIPLETIIIFAQPKNVFIPLGITRSNENPNLLLPDIYIKKGIKLTENSLYVLNIKNFYGHLGVLYKKDPLYYLKLLNP